MRCSTQIILLRKIRSEEVMTSINEKDKTITFSIKDEKDMETKEYFTPYIRR